MRREPPEVDFLREDYDIVCPVEGCGARSFYVNVTSEPDCDHEYPGKCSACDTIVGDRYSDLVWMGRKLGAEQWLCERCRGYCEECDGEGKITFDGVCGDCCIVVAADGTMLHEGKSPTLELLVKKPRWRRIDGHRCLAGLPRCSHFTCEMVAKIQAEKHAKQAGP